MEYNFTISAETSKFMLSGDISELVKAWYGAKKRWE